MCHRGIWCRHTHTHTPGNSLWGKWNNVVIKKSSDFSRWKTKTISLLLCQAVSKIQLFYQPVSFLCSDVFPDVKTSQSCIYWGLWCRFNRFSSCPGTSRLTCGFRGLPTVLKAPLTPGLFRKINSTVSMLPLVLFSVSCPGGFSSYFSILLLLCIQSRASKQASVLFFGVFFIFNLDTDPGPGSGLNLLPGSHPSNAILALDPASNWFAVCQSLQILVMLESVLFVVIISSFSSFSSTFYILEIFSGELLTYLTLSSKVDSNKPVSSLKPSRFRHQAVICAKSFWYLWSFSQELWGFCYYHHLL